ncbi:MAG: alpha/beta-type small acid-soluble spore protein [Eubacteriales bacterium]|nr:alpha/beta-type small acid-soluble spore protein [Eubacteriales bacterium]MDD3073904.1 alpha/beta-type small acid-soluble spore protein [Eubacteriales bacterium]MDD4079611.1 alpha/beta-type small acid-soluble spore protein [Eubacteriales bacterium]MDD4769805.1 alpha/beta-type small acid-soluble spore protein [Eubacteriales bacterium]
MARNRNRNKSLIDGKLLDQFKYEIADELGLREKINTQGWPNMTTRECGQIGGKIGGNMVKVMIRNAQKMMAENNNL